MNWLLTVWIWVKLGWPFASLVFDLVKDGKITHDELHRVIDFALCGREEIILWTSDNPK